MSAKREDHWIDADRWRSLRSQGLLSAHVALKEQATQEVEDDLEILELLDPEDALERLAKLHQAEELGS